MSGFPSLTLLLLLLLSLNPTPTLPFLLPLTACRTFSVKSLPDQSSRVESPSDVDSAADIFDDFLEDDDGERNTPKTWKDSVDEILDPETGMGDRQALLQVRGFFSH